MAVLANGSTKIKGKVFLKEQRKHGCSSTSAEAADPGSETDLLTFSCRPPPQKPPRSRKASTTSLRMSSRHEKRSGMGGFSKNKQKEFNSDHLIFSFFSNPPPKNPGEVMVGGGSPSLNQAQQCNNTHPHGGSLTDASTRTVLPLNYCSPKKKLFLPVSFPLKSTVILEGSWFCYNLFFFPLLFISALCFALMFHWWKAVCLSASCVAKLCLERCSLKTLH